MTTVFTYKTLMPMKTHSKPTIAITIGDPSGIGPEVTAKALRQLNLSKEIPLKIIGDQKSFDRYFNGVNSNDFLDIKIPLLLKIHPGRPSRQTAQAAAAYIDSALQMLKNNEIQGLVTAPVCKEAMVNAGIPFIGHTEYLAEHFKIKDYEMMFVGKKLRLVVATRHVPLREVSALITTEKILRTIQLTAVSLKTLFRIKTPTIGVCGLNPHAGEGGLIGDEEIKTIIPAIKMARQQGLLVKGPFPADTLFSGLRGPVFDAIIAMYHDQGLIPIKALEFKQLVNLTIGLPFIRTSPAHGTAFDIAGKNRADASSMIAAIKLTFKLLAEKNQTI